MIDKVLEIAQRTSSVYLFGTIMTIAATVLVGGEHWGLILFMTIFVALFSAATTVMFLYEDYIRSLEENK